MATKVHQSGRFCVLTGAMTLAFAAGLAKAAPGLPVWGVDQVNPCFDPDVQFGVVGAVLISWRTGDHLNPPQTFDNHTTYLFRRNYRTGTAGIYYTSSTARNRKNCWFVAGGSTGNITATGSYLWEGAFCESESCVCSHTEHTWLTASVGGVSGSISMDFNNCDFTSSGAASAVSIGSLIFTDGIEASYDVQASGDEGLSNISLTLSSEGVLTGEVETVIGDDRWQGLFASSVNKFGKFTEGCGFDGYIFEAAASISTNASVSNGAASSIATSGSWIGSNAGLAIAKKGGEDGCADPLNPGAGARGGEVRLLWDGTPVTKYLQMVALLNLPETDKIELIYMAECTGGEIDYYLSLVGEKSMAEFFEVVDRTTVNIPENDIESLEWIR